MYQLRMMPPFKDELDRLQKTVAALRKEKPDTYKSHPSYKLLAGVVKSIRTMISEPGHKRYNLGNTLLEYPTWRRIKRTGLPDRYRIFFRYWSIKSLIILAWMNGTNTLRKEGGKGDPYKVFKAMLDRADIPDTYEELLENSKKFKLSSGS